MALVAVHLSPNPPFHLLGVWLSPSTAAYLHTEGGGRARQIGADYMAGRGLEITWDEWCQLLAEKLPVAAWWQASPRADGEEARHVLARLVATEAVNRRAQTR